jgi:uncharacterized C2H2 Zn-finger protein
MAGRFTEAELEALQIDPRESAGLARCPWCGQDIIIGVRKDTRNVTLAHGGHRDPTDASGTRFITGCDPFVDALKQDDVLARLYNAGARFRKLLG